MSARLQIPPGAESDKGASELIRAWAANGGLHCSLNVDAWRGEQALISWGIVLSDVARHVAEALRENQGMDAENTLSKIRSVFNSELDKPTAETSGKFV